MDASDSAPLPVIAKNDGRQADAELEGKIEDAKCRMLAAHDRGLRKYYADLMGDLIRQRSPERIQEMEIKAGLRGP
jgi:hypothetical protein